MQCTNFLYPDESTLGSELLRVVQADIATALEMLSPLFKFKTPPALCRRRRGGITLGGVYFNSVCCDTWWWWGKRKEERYEGRGVGIMNLFAPLGLEEVRRAMTPGSEG